MVLGKFLPPHLGHLYLCEFARNYCEELTVVVGTLQAEPIPGELRFHWMQELLPNDRVVHLTDENPQYPHEHSEFWRVWHDSLLRVLPGRPEYVFASEEYGVRLAEVLGAEFVPVDIGRGVMPVSGTAVRTDPWTHWDYLPRCVRPYFVKRVCVFGPESTGKSTLRARLAEHFQTVAVPEYARTLLERQGGEIRPGDMERIARGQAASEEALARSTNRLLFCDTDLLATTIWCDVLGHPGPDWLPSEAESRRYDLTLLLDVDVPWVGDSVRYFPEERRAFFERCRQELELRNRPYVVIRGTWEERFRAAVTAVRARFDPQAAVGSSVG
jgi:NadR type nicotinamide-nucleotide adenylyltransferase